MVRHAIEFLIALVAIGVVMWLDHKGHPASGVAAGATTHLVLRAVMLRLAKREGAKLMFDFSNLPSLKDLEDKGVHAAQAAVRGLTNKFTPEVQASGDVMVAGNIQFLIALSKAAAHKELLDKLTAKHPDIAKALGGVIDTL